MAWEFDPSRLVSHPIMAGFVGALIGLRFAPGAGLLGRLVNVAAGAATAGYIAPAAAEVFSLQSPTMASALAFAIGMFGMSIAGAVQQAIRDLQLAEIIGGWIRRRGG